MSLENLNDRLDQRFRLLTGGSRSALPRQQTLRATVDWSYSLLNGPEQSRPAALVGFRRRIRPRGGRGGVRLKVTSTCSTSPTFSGRSSTRASSWPKPSGGAVRYRLLETIRQFGAERLVESRRGRGHRSWRPRMVRYFFSVAQRAAPHLSGPDQGQWINDSTRIKPTFGGHSNMPSTNPMGPTAFFALWPHCDATGGSDPEDRGRPWVSGAGDRPTRRLGGSRALGEQPRHRRGPSTQQGIRCRAKDSPSAPSRPFGLWARTEP